MHPVAELETSVPAFLGKLWKLVEDPETDDLICWAPNGRSFFIRNQAQFARELLPHYYKHNNMASFVRQLNMYGFHKKVSVELGGLKCDRDEMEFAHQYFVKGHPYLLEHIKRKIASTKTQETSHQPMKPEMMNKVLSEVRTMRGRQEHLDSRLGAMKRENEALWRELAMLRRKHLKQQEIVNKLIHFLVTLVQPARSGSLPVKRRYPLMIDNVNHKPHKQSKMSKPEASPTGPVIHELDASEHDLDSEYIITDMFESSSNPAIQSPEQEESLPLDDDHLETVETMAKAMRIPKNLSSSNSHQLSQKTNPKGKKKEETLILELSPDEEAAMPIPVVENPTPKLKPVPIKTLRSSKLAAMAANINRINDAEDDIDLDSSEDIDDVALKDADAEMLQLEDILIIPEPLNEIHTEKEEERHNGSVEKKNSNCTSWKNMNGTMNWNRKANESGVDNRSPNEASNCDDTNSVRQTESLRATSGNGSPATGSTPKSNGLSLSCVNPSGKSDVSYREDMDNHLESMQTELENLREVLRGEGYSIDANTLLGLFGADDPMSFGIPVNPELDPHNQHEREEEDRSNEHSSYTNAGGELMAYTPATSLLDFDDDIFLGTAGESSPSNPNENTNANNCYNSMDSLELEDSKASLLASLMAATNANPTTS